MAYKNLRDFLELLESRGELKRITQEEGFIHLIEE